MTELSVVLHHKLPPGVADFVSSVPGLKLRHPADDAGVASALQEGAEVLVSFTWWPDFLTSDLKWIAGCGAGIEQYPLERLKTQGVMLTTAAGVHAECVAKHAFALMLALTRRIAESVRNVTRGHWVALPEEELGGKRSAIVVLGGIGEGVARRAQTWGLDMLGIKGNPANYTFCLSDVRPPEALPEVCAWADPRVVLSAHNAGDSPGFGPRWGKLFAHNVDVLRHGGAWRNAVTPGGVLT